MKKSNFLRKWLVQLRAALIPKFKSEQLNRGDWVPWNHSTLDRVMEV